MEASHTESLAARYFRRGKTLDPKFQIVLEPPRRNQMLLSIAGNVSVPLSSIIYSTSCGQRADLEGLYLLSFVCIV